MHFLVEASVIDCDKANIKDFGFWLAPTVHFKIKNIRLHGEMCPYICQKCMDYHGKTAKMLRMSRRINSYMMERCLMQQKL